MSLTAKELDTMWERHQTDAAFNFDNHDPRSYMSVALVDRGRLLAHLRELRTGEKPQAGPTRTNWREWMVENGLGEFVNWPADEPKPQQPTFDGLLNRAWEEVCKPDDLRCPTFPDRWAAPGAPASWGATLKAVVFRAMRLAVQEIDRPTPAKQEKAA